MFDSKIARLALLIAIVGGWFLLRWLKPEWAGSFSGGWKRANTDYGWWLPAVSGGLLLALQSSWLWALYGPRRWRRGDDAVGLGCIWMAAIGLGALLVILLIGVVFRIHMIINLICIPTLILALFFLPQLAWALHGDWRKKKKRG